MKYHGGPNDCTDLLEDDRVPICWRAPLTASGFAAESHITHKHPYFDHSTDEFNKDDVIKELAVTSLASVGFKFEPANDLRSHLLLINDRRTIRVFHASAVLNETLRATSEDVTSSALLRAVALEAYSTIHDVLFPVSRKSLHLRNSLVSKHGFDKDLLDYEPVTHPQ
jgi:hypothetical protein